MIAVFGNGLVAKTLMGAPATPLPPREQFVDIDVRDVGAVRQAITERLDMLGRDCIAALVNATGYTDVDKAEDEPERANQVNGLGAERLAVVARDFNALYVHISSDAVLGGQGVYDELHEPPAPQNAYGRSKLLGEELVRRTGARALIVRTGNLYGKHGKNRASELARPLLCDSILADAERLVAPTSATALCRVMLELIQQQRTGVYHVMCRTGHERVTWQRFGARAQELWRARDKPVAGVIEPHIAPYGKAKRGLTSLLTSVILPLRGIVMPTWDEALTRHVEEEAE